MGFTPAPDASALDELAHWVTPRPDDAAGLYLGPAHVVSADGTAVLARLPGRAEPVAVLMATTMRYDPEPGDVLLVIGREQGHYAIGLIAGHGATTLIAPGDVSLAAPQGRIELIAAKGVAVRGGAFEVECESVTVTTGALTEHCRKAVRWVAGLFDLRAQQTTTVVEGVHQVKAGHIIEIADQQMRLDGAQVHLG